MTTSDYAVLAFLAGALFLAPVDRRSTILLLTLTITIGVIALFSGNIELLVAASAVLATLLLAVTSATFPLWKEHGFALIKARLQANYQDDSEDVFSLYPIGTSEGPGELIELV